MSSALAPSRRRARSYLAGGSGCGPYGCFRSTRRGDVPVGCNTGRADVGEERYFVVVNVVVVTAVGAECSGAAFLLNDADRVSARRRDLDDVAVDFDSLRRRDENC